MALKRLVAAATFGAALFLGLLTGFVSAQAPSPVPAGSTATTSLFGSDQQFGQIVLIDGQWVDATSVNPDGLQQTPEQWIRGNLEVKTYLPECPRGWTMTDKDGNEYYDSNFGTIGTPSSEAMKLHNLLGHNVEVHLVRDMPCMNTQERFWRLASVRALDGYNGTRLFLPILLRNHAFQRAIPDVYTGWIRMYHEGDMVWFVMENACGQFIANVEPIGSGWLDKWVRFYAVRESRGGVPWLIWDRNNSTVTISDQGPLCWWTATPTEPVPDPTDTPIAHYDYFGEVEAASERECAHAYIRLCGGGGTHRIALRHRTGPSYFERYIGRYVLVVGQITAVCDSVLVESIGLTPGSCATPTPTYTSTPTRTSTPTATVTPTTDPNLVEGYIILDPSPDACGNARLLTSCYRTYGWVTNADRSWNGQWVQFRINDFDVCSDPALVKVTWDGSPVRFVSPAPQCATPTFTPTATSPVNPTPTFTSTPTRTSTPVPTTAVPPTPSGMITMYLFPQDEDCSATVGVLCDGQFVEVHQAGDFKPGYAYTFAYTEASCSSSGNRLITVTSTKTEYPFGTGCPVDSPVEVPPLPGCDAIFCYKYRVLDLWPAPAQIIVLPYRRAY